MSRDFKTPGNYRSAPSQVVGETFEVGTNGVALLAEAPADPANPAFPITVTVGGNARTRVTGAPAAGQYRILSQTVVGADGQPHAEYLPLLEFHSSDNGATGAATYWRAGTVLTAEFFDLLKWFLTPLSGVANLSTLQTSYPATPDVTKRGRPGDMAFLTDGAMYFSDGLAWQQVGGVAPNTWAESVSYLGRFGISPSSAFTAAWTAANAFAAAHGFSASSAYVASGTMGASTVAAALGLSWDASFVASWTNANSLGASLGLTASTDYSGPAGQPIPTGVEFRDDFTGTINADFTSPDWESIAYSGVGTFTAKFSGTGAALNVNRASGNTAEGIAYVRTVSAFAVGTGRYVKAKTTIDNVTNTKRTVFIFAANGDVHKFAPGRTYDAGTAAYHRCVWYTNPAGTATTLYPGVSAVGSGLLQINFTDDTNVSLYHDDVLMGTIAIGDMGGAFDIGVGVVSTTSTSASSWDYAETGGL